MYKSVHEYELERLGLDEARIRKGCAAFYDQVLPPLGEKSAL